MKRKGFTLIELMFVCAAIASVFVVIAGVATAIYFICR